MEKEKLLSQSDYTTQVKKETFMGRFAARYTTPLLLTFDRYTRLNINPNHISFLNSLLMTIFGLISISYRAYFLSGLIIFLSMIIDGYDGVVARRLNKSSLSGSVFDVINDKFRDLIIGLIVYLTIRDAPFALLGVLYGPMNILPSYLRTLVYQNKIIYARIYAFHYAIRYIILFAAYTVLQLSGSTVWFAILIAVNLVGLGVTFAIYYIQLYRIALRESAGG